jgi:hypothetical protein
VVTAAAAEYLKINFEEFTIAKTTDGASPSGG